MRVWSVEPTHCSLLEAEHLRCVAGEGGAVHSACPHAEASRSLSLLISSGDQPFLIATPKIQNEMERPFSLGLYPLFLAITFQLSSLLALCSSKPVPFFRRYCVNRDVGSGKKSPPGAPCCAHRSLPAPFPSNPCSPPPSFLASFRSGPSFSPSLLRSHPLSLLGLLFPPYPTPRLRPQPRFPFPPPGPLPPPGGWRTREEGAQGTGRGRAAPPGTRGGEGEGGGGRRCEGRGSLTPSCAPSPQPQSHKSGPRRFGQW
jgi:hypothetical protein